MIVNNKLNIILHMVSKNIRPVQGGFYIWNDDIHLLIKDHTVRSEYTFPSFVTYDELQLSLVELEREALAYENRSYLPLLYLVHHFKIVELLTDKLTVLVNDEWIQIDNEHFTIQLRILNGK